MQRMDQQEARAIAALNHPHICQIHDIGPDYLVLEYVEGEHRAKLGLTGEEVYDVTGIAGGITPRMHAMVKAIDPKTGAVKDFKVRVRIDTPEELVAFRHGGILPYVLRQLAGTPRSA